MFCGECGTKNAKNAKFCEKCGAKLEVEEAPVEKEEKKKTASKKTPENKETSEVVAEKKPVKNETVNKPVKKGLSPLIKGLIIGGSCFVALVIALVVWASIITKPAHIVNNIMKAFTNETYEDIYEYMISEEPTGDTTFVSKTAFANIIRKTATKKVADYTVGTTTYSLGNLVATVPVSYTYTGGKSADDVKFTFTKTGEKRFLFFTKWKLSSGIGSSASIIKDYTIKVPKGAKLEFAGIDVDKSYLDKDESSSAFDAYKLNQVLNLRTPIKATLTNGIVIEEKVTPSKYNNTYTVKLTSSSVSQKFKDELVNEGKNDLNVWYKAITEEKAFDTLDSKKFDSKVKNEYEHDLKYIQTDSKKITKFNITKADFSSLTTTDEGYIKVFFKITYDYTVSYKDGEEMKTKDKNSYDYVYLTYDTTSKNKKLMAVSSLPTYFSKY